MSEGRGRSRWRNVSPVTIVMIAVPWTALTRADTSEREPGVEAEANDPEARSIPASPLPEMPLEESRIVGDYRLSTWTYSAVTRLSYDGLAAAGPPPVGATSFGSIGQFVHLAGPMMDTFEWYAGVGGTVASGIDGPAFLHSGAAITGDASFGIGFQAHPRLALRFDVGAGGGYRPNLQPIELLYERNPAGLLRGIDLSTLGYPVWHLRPIGLVAAYSVIDPARTPKLEIFGRFDWRWLRGSPQELDENFSLHPVSFSHSGVRIAGGATTSLEAARWTFGAQAGLEYRRNDLRFPEAGIWPNPESATTWAVAMGPSLAFRFNDVLAVGGVAGWEAGWGDVSDTDANLQTFHSSTFFIQLYAHADAGRWR